MNDEVFTYGHVIQSSIFEKKRNKSNLVKVSGKSRIYILSSESAKVSNLVLEHIHPSMQYKVLGNYPLK